MIPQELIEHILRIHPDLDQDLLVVLTRVYPTLDDGFFAALHNFLSHHVDRKGPLSQPEYEDFTRLASVYPNTSKSYIAHLLHLFSDFHNKDEIVSRIILNSKALFSKYQQRAVGNKRKCLHSPLAEDQSSGSVKLLKTNADNAGMARFFDDASQHPQVENQSTDSVKMVQGNDDHCFVLPQMAVPVPEISIPPHNRTDNLPPEMFQDHGENATVQGNASGSSSLSSHMPKRDKLSGNLPTAYEMLLRPNNKPTSSLRHGQDDREQDAVTVEVSSSSSNDELFHVDLTVEAHHEEDNSPESSSEESGNLNEINHTYPQYHQRLVGYLCEVFPDACPDYIKNLCHRKRMDDPTVEILISSILSRDGNYPKRVKQQEEPDDISLQDQLQILKDVLPDADPDYLRVICDQYSTQKDRLKLIMNEAVETRNYPKLKDYQRRQQLSAQQRQYTTDFSVENFIKLIPDPQKSFSDTKRRLKVDQYATHYALVFLRNTFDRLSVLTIQRCYYDNKQSVFRTYAQLKRIKDPKAMMKTKRRQMQLPGIIDNIPLLQEIAYLSHLEEINRYLALQKQNEQDEIKFAKSQGLMKTCCCCFGDEILPKNAFYCNNGCISCRECMVRSTEVFFGEGKLDFPCLANCSDYYNLQTLQAALPSKLFSKLAQKKALAEVKAAGIEELEVCPFCEFATIPPEGDKVFSCLNPECMKESCRECKEPSHIPLRCDEIEKDENVKVRTFLENQMTEALLRRCWKCNVKFYKVEGCNKMTCSCGAMMCYICGQAVKSYKHFNGPGGDRHDLCPLFSNTNDFNLQNVLKAAQDAKATLDGTSLKIDPTADIEKHFPSGPSTSGL